MIDVVIISCGVSDMFLRMTQDCIDSLHASETDHTFNVLVVETCSADVKYNDCTTLYFTRPKFGYHKAINFGIEHCKNEFVGFFNNDIIFKKGWFSNLVDGFKKFDSLSPNETHLNIQHKKNFVEGYEVRHEVMGWAIVVRHETLTKIGGLSEDVSFWASEAAYIEQLRHSGLTHALAVNSFVTHHTSQTLKTKNNKSTYQLTTKQQIEFKGITKQKPFFSVVMASYLEKYRNSATNRVAKFHRAVKSFLTQSYTNAELIIVADGCKKTEREYLNHYKDNPRIKCIVIPKQKYLSGSVRQAGIDLALGRWVCYLDTDDFFSVDHLKHIKKNITGLDWAYYNDWIYDGTSTSEKDVGLRIGSSGTSSIAHKRLLNISWLGLDGYTHDWEFIKQLLEVSDNYKKIGTAGYNICHTVHSKIDA